MEADDIARMEEAHDIAKIEEAQAIAKMEETQDIAKMEEAQDIAKMEEAEDIAKMEEAEDIAKMEEAQDIAKKVVAEDIAKKDEAETSEEWQHANENFVYSSDSCETIIVNTEDGIEGVSKQMSEMELAFPATEEETKGKMDQALTDYLLPVHKEYLKKLKLSDKSTDGFDDTNFKVEVQLGEDLYRYIWSPDVFKTSEGQLKRIYDEISSKLSVSTEQSDLHDLLRYFPVDVVSSKLIQLLVAMAMVEPNLVEENFNYLEELLKKQEVCMDSRSLEAYEFIACTAKRLFKILTGDGQDETPENQKIKQDKAPSNQGIKHLSYDQLNHESKGIVAGLSALYMKVFRTKYRERLERLRCAIENAPGRVEWVVYGAESLRMKRRDETIFSCKKITREESDLVELSLQMERNHPFVRWNLIQCVIDGIRETGRFYCGNILRLHDTDQSMRFLRQECMRLCDDFPRNVYFLRGVSDYFSRYVPYLYIDKELSGKLLHSAYVLNVKDPRTTHRLSIFYRMSLRNVQQSLEWLEMSLKLDPTIYVINMDYYRTILGKLDEYSNVNEQMKERLQSTNATTWRENEISEFKFYIGLACFAEGKKEDTLKIWTEVMKGTELKFNLSGLDSDCSNFNWDVELISTDKIRVWLQSEWQQMQELEKSGHLDAEEKRNIGRMFYLTLGAVPKQPDPIPNPYTPQFSNRLRL